MASPDGWCVLRRSVDASSRLYARGTSSVLRPLRQRRLRAIDGAGGDRPRIPDWRDGPGGVDQRIRQLNGCYREDHHGGARDLVVDSLRDHRIADSSEDVGVALVIERQKRLDAEAAKRETEDSQPAFESLGRMWILRRCSRWGPGSCVNNESSRYASVRYSRPILK